MAVYWLLEREVRGRMREPLLSPKPKLTRIVPTDSVFFVTRQIT